MTRWLLVTSLRVSLKHNEARAHILVYSLTDDLMFPFQMVDTVLLVREPPSALRAHKSVFFSALIL